MRSALIGHTGFVGGTLLRQRAWDDLFNSANIADIAGREYGLVVCAGVRAEKWKANQDPEGDRAGIRALEEALAGVRARHVVLISTVDVYPHPVEVDEDDVPPAGAGHPYGRHRLDFEGFVRERFDTTVVRLPGLFGAGLKKNIIFDFLHHNQVERIDSRGVFQFYDLAGLWRDVEEVRSRGVRLVNFATEPVRVDEVAEHAFGLRFHNEVVPEHARYDERTRHAELLGGRGGYLRDREEVLSALARFVRAERS